MKHRCLIFIIPILVVLFLPSLVQTQVSWQRYSGNPIFNGSTVLEPTVLYSPIDSVFKMWYTASYGGAYAIFYATSTDGKSWFPYSNSPILTADGFGFDAVSVRGPFVIFDGTTYRMYYTAYDGSVNTIGMATSPNGIDWTRNNSPVLYGTPGTWNANAAMFPSVYFDGSTYYMWYTGGSNSGYSSIGLATSTDGVAWTNDANNPILTGDGVSWDGKNMSASKVLLVGDTFYMFYDADNTGYCCSEKLGFATSTDLEHWTKYSGNPVMSAQANSWDNISLGGFSMVFLNNKFNMWYDASSSFGGWQLGYATSDFVDTTSGGGGGGAPGSKISVTVVNRHAFPGDTLLVPINVVFQINKSYSSCQFSFSGFQGNGLSFLGFDTTGTLPGKHGWYYQVNSTDQFVKIASAGSSNIAGSGVLFNLKFLVTAESVSSIPVNVTSSLFDTGLDSISTTNGAVSILLPMPGDVDLNGTIQAYDASLILKYLVGQVQIDQDQQFNADVTGDASVSAADARSILRYNVGLITSFPDTSLHGLIPSGTAKLSQMNAGLGQTINYPINLENGINIISSEGLVKYDPYVLQYMGIGSSDIMDSFTTNNIPGELRFAGYKNTAANQSGKLLELKFKVLGSLGETKISLNKLRLNEGKVVENAGSSTVILGVDNTPSPVPSDYVLYPSYPNPFNPSTTINYGLPAASHVTVTILNTLGQIVETLINEDQAQGNHQVTWKPTTSSGIYFVRLEAFGSDRINHINSSKIVYIK